MKIGTIIVSLLVASPLAAETPLNIMKDSCIVLVSQFRSPELLRADVSLYVEGLLTGAQIAHDISRDELEARIVPACLSNPVSGVRHILSRTASPADGG